MAFVEERLDTFEAVATPSAISVKNVLFATDFSALSEAALPYATVVCRHFDSTLHVAHVISEAGLLLMNGGVDYVSTATIYEDAHTEAKEKIEQVAACLERIPHRTYVRHGPIWKNLSSIIEESKIDLIVVGTHGRTGFGKLLLGSVAEDILRHASCPVLTVGPKVTGRARPPQFERSASNPAPIEIDLRQILYATNFSRESLAVAPVAIRLAKELKAQLILLHVIGDYTRLGSRPGPLEGGIQQLKELVTANAGLQYEPEAVLEFGSPANCILKIAAEHAADLLVLGARSSSDLVGTTHLPWTTVHQVVARAECPVLTVRR